jgi:hypothetical protein
MLGLRSTSVLQCGISFIPYAAPTMSDAEPLLIDAGPSPFGWSSLSSFLKCPQLWAWQYRWMRDPSLSEQERLRRVDIFGTGPLRKGSLGHVMQAHWHAQGGASDQTPVVIGLPGGVTNEWPPPTTEIIDPEAVLSPRRAARAWCRNNDDWEFFGQMVEVFEKYCDVVPDLPGDIIAVEYPLILVNGWLSSSGKYGLWLVEPSEPDLKKAQWHHLVTGEEVIPQRLGVGCPKEARRVSDGYQRSRPYLEEHALYDHPIVLTRRLDLVIRYHGSAGGYSIWDHKHTSNVQPSRADKGYWIDAGFGSYRVIGEQMWPEEFGRRGTGKDGVVLNLIPSSAIPRGKKKFKPEPVSVAAAPERDRKLPILIADAWAARAELEVETDQGLRAVGEWVAPLGADQTTCDGRYGICRALKLCGKGAL